MKKKSLIYLLILSILLGNSIYLNKSVPKAATEDLVSICPNQVYSFTCRTDYYLSCNISSSNLSVARASVQHGYVGSKQVTITITGISEGTSTIKLYFLSSTIKTFKVEVVKHQELRLVEKKDATCTEDGYNEHYMCDKCDSAFADAEGNDLLPASTYTIPATGHTIQHMEYILPTFEAAGHTSYYYCSVCDTGFSDAEGANKLRPSSYILPQLDNNSILPTGISLNIPNFNLYIGETAYVEAEISPKTSQFPLKITSSDENVASVDEFRIIYAKGSGTCDIVFETINGISAICKVTVDDKPEVSDTLKITSVSMNHLNASLELSTSDNNLYNQSVTIYAKDDNRQIIGKCTATFTKATSSAYMDFLRTVKAGEKIEFYAQKSDHSLSPSVIESKGKCGTYTNGTYSVGPNGATGHCKQLAGQGGTVTVTVSGKKYTETIDKNGSWNVCFDTPIMEGLEVTIQEQCPAGCEFKEHTEKCKTEDIYYYFGCEPSVYTNYVCLDNDYFSSEKIAYVNCNGKDYVLRDTPSITTKLYYIYYLPEPLEENSPVSVVIKNKYTGITLSKSNQKVKLPDIQVSSALFYEEENQISVGIFNNSDLRVKLYYSVNNTIYTQNINSSDMFISEYINLPEKYAQGTTVYIWLEDTSGYTSPKKTCNIKYIYSDNNDSDNNDNRYDNPDNDTNYDDTDYDDDDYDDDDDDDDEPKPKTKSYATSLKVPKKISIAVNTKRKISAKRVKSNTKMPKLKWKSSNKKIATVDSTGKISAHRIGKCKIYCIIQNGKGKGKKFTCSVKVRKNTYTGYKKSDLNVNSYRYGQVYLEVAKAYYSGNKLIVKCVALNNRMFRAVKFQKIDLKITTQEEDVIARRTFRNYPLNMGKYSKKYVTFTFPKKYQKAKRDLQYYGVDVDYNYTYTYHIG